MSTTHFVLRLDKANKNGFFPIDLIYQINGRRKYYRTNEKLPQGNWNQKQAEAVYLEKREAKKLETSKKIATVDYDLRPSAKEVVNINHNLSSFKKQISDIEKQFELQKVLYSVDSVVQILKESIKPTTKTTAPTNQVFDFIDKYIEDNKASREPGSLSVYKSLKNHLQGFQIKKKRIVTFDSIDYSFFLEFQNYLINARSKRTPTGLGNVTIAKQLSTLKTFLNYARIHGIDVSNRYKDFKIKKEELEVIALTNTEFEMLYNFDLSDNKRLSQVRDVFCFSCVTSLRYSDLASLKRENIKDDEIRITVNKTKQLLTIPLNNYSQSILDKYVTMQRPLPVISNPKTSLYIKELCKLAGIDEPVQIVRFKGAKREETTYPKHELLSCHSARRTFASLSLERGMSAEETMRVGGWRTYSSFSRYVKVTEQRTKLVMRNAWGEIKIQKLKAV